MCLDVHSESSLSVEAKFATSHFHVKLWKAMGPQALIALLNILELF